MTPRPPTFRRHSVRDRAEVLNFTRMITYARKCSKTGEGMNSGWVADNGDEYFKNEVDAIHWCHMAGYADIDAAFADDAIYWTEWADDDHQYGIINGKLVAIDEDGEPLTDRAPYDED